MSLAPNILINSVLILLAVQVIISTAELIRIYPAYRDEGLFSWKVQRSSRSLSVKVKKYRLDVLCKYPNVLVLLALRILSGIAIPVLIYLNYSLVIPLAVITFTNLIFQVRNNQSNDGSDQMATICFIAVMLAAIINTELSWSIALIFIAAQSSLAYGISGILKMTKKEWHNGESVLRVLKTSSYGNKKGLEWALDYHWLAKAFGMLVIYGDTLLAFSFALPPYVCGGVLIFGVCLHIGIGRVMGLNTFLWSYVSTYPAIFYVSTLLYA